MRSSLVLLLCCSCSYAFVNGPPAESTSTTVTCTDSDVVPAIDSIVGVLGVTGAIGGEIADRLSSHPLDHYELYIGLPALVAGIIFLVSASSGTDKVAACTAAKHGPTQDQPRGCDGCPAAVP